MFALIVSARVARAESDVPEKFIGVYVPDGATWRALENDLEQLEPIDMAKSSLGCRVMELFADQIPSFTSLSDFSSALFDSETRDSPIRVGIARISPRIPIEYSVQLPHHAL